ncbi:methyltransferase domain-containing protein [Candidatus Peregrinibacteria bacterium]|nr:methyltransferase domain-containing protein [Candidatus Peregrinibacteria bacterium]
MFWKLYSSDYNKLDRKFQEMNEVLKENNIDLMGKVVLELGPGNSNINAYNFLLLGAKKVILVDKFPRSLKTAKQKKYAEDEIRFIREKNSGADFFFFEGFKLKPGYIEFISQDLTEVKNLQVDFIYSISVLEHIKSIEENIRKMSEILKEGGHMYHSIDMRDHFNFNNPFLFYKYSDSTWDKYLTKEGASYTNRWRYDDFKEAFRNSGIKTSSEKTVKYSLKNIKLNEKYNNKKDIDIGELKIILNK